MEKTNARFEFNEQKLVKSCWFCKFLQDYGTIKFPVMNLGSQQKKEKNLKIEIKFTDYMLE